jgi:lipopolysaccharide/colanic/teichoic acid biosynthesis glycosyltransferase
MSGLFIKRLFDVVGSVFGLSVVLFIIFIAWIIAAIETQSNGFFVQQRVGKDSKLFNVIKIKTMKIVKGVETTVTSSNDARITTTGAFFRKTKIDELPQLWNVLVGEMSFVGPRPDVPGYADRLQGEDRIVLSIRPGITGPAQLTYRGEEDILAAQNDPVKYNDEVIWPDKVKINLDYIANYSFFKDLYYIWKTIVGGNVKY